MNWNANSKTPGADRPLTFASAAELNRHIEHARVLRSETTAAMLGAGFRALARPVLALVAGAARWRQRRATEAALMRCSDRVLADVGFAREDIALIARGLDPKQQPERAGAGWRRWPARFTDGEAPDPIRRGASDGWPGHHPQALADRA